MSRSPSLLAAGAVLVLLSSCTEDATTTVDPSLIHTVGRGDLAISVREQGELEAEHSTKVISQVEGTARLIYLIQQGTEVKKDEKVAELDVSTLREKRALQAISVAKAAAALEQAEKRVAIMEKEIEAAENTAESRLRIAELRVEKLIGQRRPTSRNANGSNEGTNAEMIAKLRELIASESTGGAKGRAKHENLLRDAQKLLGDPANAELEMGELANQILTVIDEISLARVDLKIAQETLGHSRRLRAKDFITQNELERDQINYKRLLSKVTLAWNNLHLLVQYTIPETKIERQQEAENARLGLLSVQATSEANRVKERAALDSATAENALARERLENLDTQIENSIVRAPEQGEVVYAYQRRRRGWVREGEDVDERQTIAYLPDLRSMVVRVMVHEAQITKVTIGQIASVRIDALPKESLFGRVISVSSLPDASSRWGNRNLKLYKVFVRVDRKNDDRAMRPGMTASVRIRCGVIENALHIPMVALHRRGNRSYAFKETPDGPVPVALEFGASNLAQVEVLDGLGEGDRIYLVPPPGVSLPKPPREDLEKDVEYDEDGEANPATGTREDATATEASSTGTTGAIQNGTSK